MNTNFTPFHLPANFWKKNWQSMAQLICNGLFKSSVVVVSYYLIKSLSRQIKTGQMIEINIVLSLLLIAVLLVVLRVHERYTSEKMSQKFINRIRSTLLKRIMRASIRNLQQQTIGNLSSRLAGDLTAIKKWLSLGITRIITHSLLLIITMILIFNINNQLGIYITVSVIGLISVSVLLGGQLKQSIKKVRKNRIKIHSLLVERLSSIATIRSMGMEQPEISKITKQANKLEKNITTQGIYLGLLRGIGDASSLILIAVFFSFQYFHQNSLSVEELTALISVVLFLNSPIRELGRVQEYYQGAKLSLEKIQQLYEIPRIIRGKSKQQNIMHSKGSIYIKNLNFNGVFTNLTMRAKPSDHIALTGKNGAGKSTLIHILLGLLSPDSGTIRINKIRPQKSSSYIRSNQIGVCGVDMTIIKGSLFKNLTYRKPQYQKQEFNNLIQFCQLDQLIKKLPKGLSTQVKENGSNFSSGEKTRISLFRALLGNPSLLILDEPESYLDKKGLEIIKSLLDEYNGTILIATHHPQLLARCNKEWNLDKLNLKTKPKKNPIKLIKNL